MVLIIGDEDFFHTTLTAELYDVWSKNPNRFEWRGLGFCAASLFEWGSPTQKQRPQSRFHEVIDDRGIEDAMGAPARLCHRAVNPYLRRTQALRSVEKGRFLYR